LARPVFVPIDQQNGGALEDGGATGGGFGIYVEPATVEQIVTFVVGQRDGLLVPLWDMSRDPALPPQPFAVSANPFDPQADPLAGIDLGSLDGGAISATANATAQVVESGSGVNCPHHDAQRNSTISTASSVMCHRAACCLGWRR
jgi:hypothetical protein